MPSPRALAPLAAAALALTGLGLPATAQPQHARAATLQYAGDFAGPGTAELTPVDVAVGKTSYYALDVARYRIVRVDRDTGRSSPRSAAAAATGPASWRPRGPSPDLQR